MRWATFVAALLACLLSGSPAAARKVSPWKVEAHAEKLSGTEIDQLAEHKILITDRNVWQVFMPYVEPEKPVFITSDSILNGFHVLYAESILHLELTNAAKLPGGLRSVWANLQGADRHVRGRPKLAAAAKRRARIILATGLKLLGDDEVRLEGELTKIVSEEVRKVTAAQGQDKPEWLGPPEEGVVAIDYSRYKPRGFYWRFPLLQRYFRAVSWLQSIPFRAEDDEELLAILMLGSAAAEGRFPDQAAAKDFTRLFRCFRYFLGDQDDWDLLTAAEVAGERLELDLDGDDLAMVRQRLVEKAKREGHRPLIYDQVGYGPDEGPSFRVISAYRTPDAILFEQTTNGLVPVALDRFPNGLEVCIALGSPYAEQAFDDPLKAAVLEKIRESKPQFRGNSLYFDYLDCLAALLDEPDAGAPAFMRNAHWQAKSCQTALAGWAQMRHTWSLQAKYNCAVFFAMDKEYYAGFVEPDPQFFARLRKLVDETVKLLKEADAFGFKPQVATSGFVELLDVLQRKSEAGEDIEIEYEKLTPEEYRILHGSERVLRDLGVPVSGVIPVKNCRKAIPKLRALVEDLGKGKMPEDSGLAERVGWQQIDYLPLWERLLRLCDGLEEIAAKEVEGKPLSAEDDAFIVDYGDALSRVMFHTSIASGSPRDDAPRIVDVFYNPNVGRHLHVGIARPRMAYVLYPAPEGEVLCRAAVLPYREFTHPERLDDLHWRAMLDAGEDPGPPPWLKEVPAIAGEIDKSFSLSAYFPGGRVGLYVAAAAALLLAVLVVVMRMRRRRAKRRAGEETIAPGPFTPW